MSLTTSLTAERLAQLKVPSRLIRTLTALAEFRGKQTLWTQTKPEVLQALRRVALIESAESSSRMEAVEVGPQTASRILQHSEEPDRSNRSQAELAGYRDALRLIHENAADMAPSENVVRQLHGILMRYTSEGGGRYKSAANDIVEKDEAGRITRIRLRTTSPALTPAAMTTLHEQLAAALQAEEVEPLLLVAPYVHDLLSIHPFPDGNGRIARLLTILLLHRTGYDVGRYVSLERIIEETKETYYGSLAAADQGWPQAHDPLPFTEYLLNVVVLEAYRELERKTSLELDHGARTRMVEQAVLTMPSEFRFADIASQCPLVNQGTIRTILSRLGREKRIAAITRGRNAVWRRLR